MNQATLTHINFHQENQISPQKRKAKAAISVQALHDLEEIAHPSDSFPFYQDVEKEIEQATAVKLERFITMKTGPIHNSVKKWAERAKNGVKSIVGWIKTGKKNNREIIKRVEKRQRDHFQHEAHKKPRKKTKGRDSTVYSTTRQTSLCDFISLKNDLY